MIRLLAISLALITASAIAAPSVPDVLSAQTPVLIGTPNFSVLKADIEHTPLWGLWQEPSVQGFFRPLTESMDEEFGEELDPVDAYGFLALFEGQVWFGISEVQMGGSAMGPFIIGETDQPEQVMALIDQAIADAEGVMSRTEVTIQDVPVTQTTVQVALPSGLTGHSSTMSGVQTSRAEMIVLNTAHVDGLFLMGVDIGIDGLISAIRSEASDAESVASLAQTTAGFAEATDGDLLVHICPASLNSLLQSVPSNQGFNPNALGLTDFEGISIAMDFSAATTETWATISLAPNLVGLGRLFSHGGESDYPALDWVPADVASVSANNVDIAAAFRDLRRILRLASPQLDMMASSVLITLNQSLGFDLEHDLIGSLSGDFIAFTVAHDNTENPYVPPMTNVMFLKLSNPSAVENILATFAEPPAPGSAQLMGPNPLLEEREHSGQTFYSPPAVFAGPMSVAPIPAFAVIDDQLVFSSSVPQLQAVIASMQGEQVATIRDSALWAEVQEYSLPGATSFSYQDDAVVMTALAQSLQQMGMMFLLMPEVSPPFDFTSVPQAEVFERHMTHTVSSGRTTAGGIVYHSWSPNH